MRAELRVVFRDDLLEQRDRFHRVLARLLGDRIEAVVERQAEHRLRFEVVRDTRRPACAGRRCRRHRPPPSGRSRGAPPAIRCRAARAASPCRAAPSPWRSLRARGPADRSRRRWSTAPRRRASRPAPAPAPRRVPAFAGVAQQLERRAVVAGRAQRDAPVAPSPCSGRAASACVHDRSDSWNQNE